MIKTIIIVVLAITATKQACDVGCLKCSSTGDCLIPDILNSYYLNGTTATKASLPNCALNNLDGKCVACSSGYYLDSATSKCVSNPTTGITNCAYYGSATSCNICNQDYYLNNNACVAVESKISNCAAYIGASTCSNCAKNYLLSLDSKSCAASPSIPNCGDFTFVKCNTCDSGYVLNPNNYLDLNLASTSPADKNTLASFANSINDISSSNVAQNACQVQSTKYCNLFDQGTNTCTTCSSGYYLDATNANCIVFPDEPIENCQTYTSVNTCSVCVAGYYFKSGICTQITGTDIIVNCSTYKGDASTVQCSACSANFFLSNNTCAARTLSADNKIANCATKNVSADTCAACSSGFVLASDNQFCFTAIANCKVYDSIPTGQINKCKSCNSGFYLTNLDSTGTNSCLQGNVVGCSEYPNAAPATCTTCLNKYLTSPTLCTLQTDIAKCDTYSSTESMTCLKCNNPGYFNFFLEKYCQNIPSASLITKCVSYGGDLTAPTCSVCADGYFVKANVCVATNIPNCLTISDAGLCTACKTGFAIALDGATCVSALNFITDNCLTNSTVDVSNTESAKNADCRVCQNGAIPFDQKNYYVCISYAEALQYSASAPTEGVSGSNKCIKYNSSFECVQCDVDSATPYLNTTTKTCVASCTNNSYKKYIYGKVDSADANTFNILQLNVCFEGAVAGCEVYAPDLTNDETTFICVKCQSTYHNILAPAESAYTNVDPSGTSSGTFFISAFAKFPKVTCGLISAVLKLGGNDLINSVKTIANCAYYFQEANANEYSCLRCDMGYVGTVNSGNKIEACTRNTECSIEKYYNLDSAINNLASCHKCSSSGIPFIAYSATDPKGTAYANFAKYKLAWSTNFLDASGIASNIACRANASSTFSGLASYILPEKCGLAVIVINSNGLFTDLPAPADSSYGIFCAACAPRYKPTLLTSNSAGQLYVKKACTEITNCASSSTYFNACSACNTGFILAYASNNVDFTTCLAITQTTSLLFDNCLAASASAVTATNAGTCKVCKTGFFLNSDSVCERYQPVNCNTSGFIPVQTKSSSSTLDWSLALNATTVGCNKCSSGIAYKMDNSKVTCMKSDWVSKSVDTQTAVTTTFIKYCKNYQIDTTLANNRKCNVCNTTNVISGVLNSGTVTQNGLSCFNNSQLLNCAVASTETSCIQCADATFSLKGVKCELGNIANCVAYNYNNSLPNITCVDCAADYYLDTAKNSCALGQIYNCKRLANNNDGKLCTICMDGFVNISVDAGNGYCYPKDTSIGCNGMTIINDTTYGGRINCNSCTNSATQAYGSAPLTSTKTICMAHHLIGNCKSYGIGNNINTSTFRCTECNAGFYLSQSVNRCVARINQPAKCTLYSVTDDTCNTCDSTSYLSNASKACTDYPKGILGCRTYSNATTCTACKDARYLSANACPKVTTAIANCLYYSSNTACFLCNLSYALINNTCVKASATNCATYTSDTVCATCPVGHVLQTANSLTNCIAQTKTGCALVDVNTPYNCLACTGVFYLEAGECKIPTTIVNCAAYDSKLTCSQCSKGFALSVDKTACVNSVPTATYIDTQCTDSQINSTPVCSRCGAGFYFVNGACTGTCNSGSASGCLACSPKTATTCYVCKSGFYQNKDGVCKPNVVVPASTFIQGTFAVLVALVAFMF